MSSLNNITFNQYIKHYLLSAKERIRSANRYRKTYRNYLQVIRSITQSKYPILAYLRNGHQVTINNKNEAYVLTTGFNNYIRNEGGHAVIFNEKLGSEITMQGGEDNGEIMEVFFKQGYGMLPVKNRFVIDVGTNIADSAIYFAMKGAKKIIALEPYPKNYEIAKSNIKLNRLSNKIDLVMGAISNRGGVIKIDTEREGMHVLEASNMGVEVPLMTLEQILDRYDIKSAVLKMDCEGCEYPSILSSSKETLRRFTDIQIEYHDGFKNIKEKLEMSGFNVSVFTPFSKSQRNGKIKYLGYLYAELQ